MDYVPLNRQTDTPSMPEGVGVIYDRDDVAGVLDILEFVNSYQELTKKADDNVPAILFDGTQANPKTLLEQLNEIFPDGDGEMNTTIVIQILDGDRDFFEEYMNHLEDLILTDDEEPQEDTEHPLYDFYDMFIDIEIEFFPQKEDMN